MTGAVPSGMDQALEVVSEHFPGHELAIRRLMKINDAFREMCVDLAEAKAALGMASGASDQNQDGRSSEWSEIVDRLHGDVSAALQDYEASLLHVRR